MDFNLPLNNVEEEDNISNSKRPYSEKEKTSLLDLVSEYLTEIEAKTTVFGLSAAKC